MKKCSGRAGGAACPCLHVSACLSASWRTLAQAAMAALWATTSAATPAASISRNTRMDCSHCTHQPASSGGDTVRGGARQSVRVPAGRPAHAFLHPPGRPTTTSSRSSRCSAHLPRPLQAAHQRGVVHHIQLQACRQAGVMRGGRRSVHTHMHAAPCFAIQLPGSCSQPEHGCHLPAHCSPLLLPPTRHILGSPGPGQRLLPAPAGLAGAEQGAAGEGIPGHPSRLHVF